MKQISICQAGKKIKGESDGNLPAFDEGEPGSVEQSIQHSKRADFSQIPGKQLIFAELLDCVDKDFGYCWVQHWDIPLKIIGPRTISRLFLQYNISYLHENDH
jgi:hypothetical protein